MRKWYVGLNASEIIKDMKKVAKTSIVFARSERFKVAEEVYDEFMEKFKEVIPAIVEIKTAYWRFRNYNTVYDEWDNCQRELWAIRNNLENELEILFENVE